MQFSTTKVCYLLSTLLSLTTLFDVAKCHVGLSFPPARKYDLDFLDNVRTKPPCGMPKGRKSFFLLKLFMSCCPHPIYACVFCIAMCNCIVEPNQDKHLKMYPNVENACLNSRWQLCSNSFAVVVVHANYSNFITSVESF